MTENMGTMSDHDILITLVESVKNNHQNLAGKIDDVRNEVRVLKDIDLKEIKDATNLKLAEHEARIKMLEGIASEYKPGPLVEMLRAHDQWIHDFKLTWKTVLGITATISAIITFLLTTLTHINSLFGGK